MLLFLLKEVTWKYVVFKTTVQPGEFLEGQTCFSVISTTRLVNKTSQLKLYSTKQLKKAVKRSIQLFCLNEKMKYHSWVGEKDIKRFSHHWELVTTFSSHLYIRKREVHCVLHFFLASLFKAFVPLSFCQWTYCPLHIVRMFHSRFHWRTVRYKPRLFACKLGMCSGIKSSF